MNMAVHLNGDPPQQGVHAYNPTPPQQGVHAYNPTPPQQYVNDRQPETVRVTLLRGYVPRDMKPDPSGTYRKRKAGEVIEVSVRDGMYLCSHGIARMDLEDVANS
jgi:hypothetical protein